MGTANETLPALGFQLDYGWMSKHGNVHHGNAVPLDARTSVWD